MQVTMDKSRIGALACAIAAIWGCSSLPDRVETLEQARSDVRTLEQDPLASEAASTQLAAAHEAIQAADKAYEERESLELVEHKAYVAQRNVDIAKQRIAQAHAKQEIASSESERNRVLLESREREATALEERNRAAQLRNEELASRAEALEAQAEQAQSQAEQAAARSAELEAALTDLQAQRTERGLVLTLGDVLFDTEQATLKAGADRTLDRLASFMTEYPQRQVAIEGHTDSRGSDEYNRDLSKRRADAVRDALVERGVEAQRIRSLGLGETYPVAGNDTPGGMQQNRRVEIVISDESGKFPAGQRSATASN
jgi:outer membrane protein OmpA-like peptidoglycan-associated protein